MNIVLGIFLLSGLAFGQDLDFHRRESSLAFAKEFGVSGGEILIEENSQDCLRTGYQRSSGKIIFCSGSRVINGGRSSVDVIHHEFFHALFCGVNPELCADPENDYLQEALADAFAFRLTPDEFFGENFYTDQPYIRKYQTDWLPELVQSEHEKGSAVAAKFIRSGKPLSTFLPLFGKPMPSFVSVSVLGAPYSKLNRYRLKKNQTVSFNFQFDPSVKVKTISWQTPPGVEIVTNGLSSSIRLTEVFQGDKSFVSFKTDDGKEVGRWTFYFGREI